MASLPARVWRDFTSPVPNTTDPAKVGSTAWNDDLNVFLGTVCEALSRLEPAADKLTYFDGADTAKLTTLTSFARLLLASSDDTVARALLGALGVGGGTMFGNLAMNGNRITDLGAPSSASDAARKADVDAVVALVSGALAFKGGFDASAGNFTAIAAGAKLGWFWKVDTAGTVSGVTFTVGDSLFALVDSPSSSTYEGNWLKVEGTMTAAEIIAALGYTPVTDARTISTSGLATGGGTLSANRTITVPKASGSDVATGTDDTKAITPKALADAGFAGAGGVPIGSTILINHNADVPANYLKENGASYSSTTYADLFAVLVKSSAVTMTIASPGVLTWTGHKLNANDPVKFTTTGALPTGLAAGTTYYVRDISGNTFKVSATPNGAAINTSGTQSGTHKAINAPHGCANDLSAFNVPDSRGEFIRLWDDGRGVDADRSFGSSQADAMQGHRHDVLLDNVVAAPGPSGSFATTGSTTGLIFSGDRFAVGNPKTDGVNGVPRTAAETRPRNIPKIACIRYA